MVTHRQLQELLDAKTRGPRFISVYLDLGPRGDAPAAFSALLKRSGACLLKPEFDEDLKRISLYLKEEFQPGPCRGLALFSAGGSGLWRALPLPQPARSAVFLDDHAALGPLLSLTDQYHRFGVALLGEGHARFLEVFMGGVQEHADLALSRGSGEPGAFAKKAACTLQSLSRRRGFQRLILAAPPEVEPLFIDQLHAFARNSLIIDGSLDIGFDRTQVLERVMVRETEARWVRESVLAHRLLDAAASGEAAVLGLEGTLHAFRRGLVKVLYVRDGYAKLGRLCGYCGRLSLLEARCLGGRKPTEAVFDVVGELIERAQEQGREVFRLFQPTPLDNHGRIGAELSQGPSDPPSYPPGYALLDRGAPAPRPTCPETPVKTEDRR